MTNRRSSAFIRLAVAAAKNVGLALPSPNGSGSETQAKWLEAVAKDAAARAERDRLWQEYEGRLADECTYTLKALTAWLEEQGAKISLMAVQRDRLAIIADMNRFRYAADKARATIDAATDRGESDLFRAGRVAAGQLIFNALMEITPAQLENLEPKFILKLMEISGKLSKAHAETDLLNQKIEELRKAFDEQVAAAQKKSPDGKLTADMLLEAKEAIFGKVA
jgi:hypothetical protein